MAARTGIVEETDPHPRLVVYPSRVRVALSLTLMIVVLFPLGLWVLAIGVVDRELVPVAAGLLLAVGCLGLGVRGVWMMRGEPHPLLVVDSEGLWDRWAGRLPWSEVAEIGIVRLKRTTYVVVQPWDLHVLDNPGVPHARGVRSNLRWLGAPIGIPTAAIPGSGEELIARIERYRPW